MPNSPPKTRPPLGEAWAARLEDTRREYAKLPAEGARELPLIKDISPECQTTGDLDSRLAEIGQILVDSGRVFQRGASVVFQSQCDDGSWSLAPLSISGKLEPGAPGRLANLFQCQVERNGRSSRFPPSSAIVSTVLHREPTLQELPKIKVLARHPVYDDKFRLCQSGYDAESGILVYAPQIDVSVAAAPGSPDLPYLERLPPMLRSLLSGFCFRSEADCTNAVGAMLTGLLMPQFIRSGHGLVLLDGNQPGVGKTLLARTIGVVLDGVDPDVIPFKQNDEELGKCLLATLRTERSSCVIIDNAKLPAQMELSSIVIESNSTAPRISLRVLQTSSNYTRDNDLIWFLTMNHTRAKGDIVRRSLPIRLEFTGDPRQRRFADNPVEFAHTHRDEILAELVALVEYWKQQGRKLRDVTHSLGDWARTIASVLHANGLPQFLTNFTEAADEFERENEEFAALAEQVYAAKSGLMFRHPELGASPEELQPLIEKHGAAAGKFRPVFEKAKVLEEALAATKSERSRGRQIGEVLKKMIGRQINVRVGDVDMIAILRSCAGRANQTLYCFQFVESDTAVEPPPPEATSSNRRKLPKQGGEAKPAPTTDTPSPPPANSAANKEPPSAGNDEEWG